MTEAPNLDWITYTSDENFRSIVSNYPPGPLKKLRSDLIVKLRALNEQRIEPMSAKTDHHGNPWSKEKYESWCNSIEAAQRFTERQLEFVNGRIADIGPIGGMPTSDVIRALYRMASVYVPASEDDDNLLRLVGHHLKERV